MREREEMSALFINPAGAFSGTGGRFSFSEKKILPKRKFIDPFTLHFALLTLFSDAFFQLF